MLNPKNAFGDVTVEAVCAAGKVAAMMTSAAMSVSARTRRTNMGPPSWRPHTVSLGTKHPTDLGQGVAGPSAIRLPRDRRADWRRAGLRHHAATVRAAVHVD